MSGTCSLFNPFGDPWSSCLLPSYYHTIALISHVSKQFSKIRQTRLEQYMNWQLSDVQAVFRKGRGTRDQIASIHWRSWKKQENSRKNIYFIEYAKVFDCVDHNKLWEILKEMGIPDQLICLLRSLYAGQKATVRTGHGRTSGSKIGKEYVKTVYCHPAYLTHMQVHNAKCGAGWSTSRNHGFWEK